jgi:peptidoglycan hydrolase CwlO-like protein
MILTFWACSVLTVLLRLERRWEALDANADKEIPMSAAGQDDRKIYSTPARVQAWFLQRSRDNWKKKYTHLKADAKRLQNRVNDVTKSREKWREQSEQLNRRLCELAAENAALHEQLAALKKDGLRRATGLAP